MTKQKNNISLLRKLEKEHNQSCSHCAPKKTKLRMVFGEGSPNALIMFVGEGPGEEEDKQGRPFVGRAGKLLDKWIISIGLTREDVYIANIVKSRPPNNRVPTPEEAEKCMPYLIQQIEIVKPGVIVTLGATASKYLLENPKLSITKERGSWKKFRGIPVMPTYHPAYVLRAYTMENRKKVSNDLKKVLKKSGLPIPKNNG